MKKLIWGLLEELEKMITFNTDFYKRTQQTCLFPA